jgi:thiol:disulfide interchange protein
MMDPVKSVLVGDDVIAITVDLTSRSAAGWERLSDLGQTGIPTLAVFGPGLADGPWIANAYTSGQVLEAIERARGESGGSVAAAD